MSTFPLQFHALELQMYGYMKMFRKEIELNERRISKYISIGSLTKFLRLYKLTEHFLYPYL